MHSGDDLASAAERVLGCTKRSRKGKEVFIPPLPKLATPQLAALLAAAVGDGAVPGDAAGKGAASSGDARAVSEVANVVPEPAAAQAGGLLALCLATTRAVSGGRPCRHTEKQHLCVWAYNLCWRHKVLVVRNIASVSPILPRVPSSRGHWCFIVMPQADGNPVAALAARLETLVAARRAVAAALPDVPQDRLRCVPAISLKTHGVPHSCRFFPLHIGFIRS